MFRVRGELPSGVPAETQIPKNQIPKNQIIAMPPFTCTVWPVT